MSTNPSFGEHHHDTFESIMRDVMPGIASLEEEFNELDVQKEIERRSAASEASVINYLENKIPYIDVLNRMLDSLRESGTDNPTCNSIMDTMDEMSEDEEFMKNNDKLIQEMAKMYGLTMVIEQIAKSETRVVELSKEDIFKQIVTDDLFTHNERNVLKEAADFFLSKE